VFTQTEEWSLESSCRRLADSVAEFYSAENPPKKIG